MCLFKYSMSYGYTQVLCLFKYEKFSSVKLCMTTFTTFTNKKVNRNQSHRKAEDIREEGKINLMAKFIIQTEVFISFR